jgi:hypothetical protein
MVGVRRDRYAVVPTSAGSRRKASSSHDVRSALDLDVARVRERRVQAPSLPVDREDAVGGAVQDQGGDVDPPDVLGEVVEPPLHAGSGRKRRRLGAGVPRGAHRLLADPPAEVVVEVEEVAE